VRVKIKHVKQNLLKVFCRCCEGSLQSSPVTSLHQFLEPSSSLDSLAVPLTLQYKHFWTMDLVTPLSTHSCCFTKRSVCLSLCLSEFVMSYISVIIGSRPSDHYFRSVCWFVCLFVCLCSFSQPSLIRFRSNLDICYIFGSSYVP